MSFIDTIHAAVADYNKQHLAPTTAERLRHVIQTLNGVGIKANYDPVPATVNGRPAEGPTRVLFYSTRYNVRNPECNGIILDFTTWQVVYRPPEIPNAQFTVARVADNFAEYDIFDLNDGTVVGLYHYQDKWRIATARGLDMGAVRWCGISYQTALESAMAQAKYPAPSRQGESPDLESRPLLWSELDIDVSYTVGFTHPKMHFSQHGGMWLIRARVTNTEIDISDDQTALACQPGPLLDLAQFEMPVQRQVAAGTFASFRDLQQLCNDPKATCWGFMMRSRDACLTGADSTVLIESRRMNLVRTMVYDRHMQEDADALGVTRKQLAFVQCLLDQNLRESYLQLYPQNAELQTRAVQELEEVADQVLVQPKKSKAAAWFRSHLQRERPLEGLARQQVLDFMLTRAHISILLRHLQPLLPVEEH